MATAMTALPSSNPPTPPAFTFPRLPSSVGSSSSSVQRNASSSSSLSTRTTSSTASLAAVPIRPPPLQTRTAATDSAQLPSDALDRDHAHAHSSRGIMRNGPRTARSTLVPAIVTDSPPRSGTEPYAPSSKSPTTPRASQVGWERSESPVGMRMTVSMDPANGNTPRGRELSGARSHASSSRTQSTGQAGREVSADGIPKEGERQRRPSTASAQSTMPKKQSIKDWILGEELGRGSYSTVSRLRRLPILPDKQGGRSDACPYFFLELIASNQAIRYQDH